ncbi:MAG: hypothetical protein ACK6DR_01495 [Gemmatimonas sp.]|jgi:hypothetical protein|uniref:hypothetical protein n=1 Tax=Gemmatimonas sp. TaxID=1962908 RepID=UPI00391C413E
MTVVFSAASERLVLMAADSAVSLDFEHGREYETGRKLYYVDGVGCVSTWGARNANDIGKYLREAWATPGARTVDDLARGVHAWLVENYQPDVMGLGDVGYHTAGFLPSGRPALYHSFWNVPGDATSLGSYTFQMIGPKGSITQFLYNGRNDIAQRVIEALLSEVRAGKETHFSPRSPGGILYLAHLVLRFAAELTPEVGPPFVVRAIAPDGRTASRRLEVTPVPSLAECDEWCNALFDSPQVCEGDV